MLTHGPPPECRLLPALLLALLLLSCSPPAPVGQPTALPARPTLSAPSPLPSVGGGQPGQPPSAAGPIVVDNGDAGFAVLDGEWGECWRDECGGNPYGGNFRFADPGCTGCRALFVLPLQEAGDYDVWAWWPAGEDRATDTPVTISYRDGDYSLHLDQRNGGDGWLWLAQLPFTAGPVRITVGGADSGYANADAMALTPAGQGAPGEYAGSAETPSAVPTVEVVLPTPPSILPTRPPVVPGSAVVVDYRMSDISQIPDEWIERAKQLTVHYAHTSHGSQIVTGLEWLAAQDPRYAVAVRYCGEDLGLPEADGALRICDGNPPDDYVTPELYWSTEEGLARTRAAAATGLFDFSMWSWCGQQSDNDAATVQQYLATLDRLEAEYPGMRFIYMTGHTDGGSETLARNNEQVRSYVVQHGKVLFDFASFEMYDPAGRYYPQASDACDWCESWCDAHPADCRGLEQIDDCAHTHPLQCKLKAQAFWWLMAVLAGWDGRP